MNIDATGDDVYEREEIQERVTFLIKFLSRYALRANSSRAPDREIKKGISLGAFESREEAELLIASTRGRAERAKVIWQGDSGIPRDLSSAEEVKAEIDELIKKHRHVQNALSSIGPILSAALARGAWRTQTEAAAALDLSKADVQVAVAIGRLPTPVFDCFRPGELRAPILRRLHALARSQGWETLTANASRCLAPTGRRRRPIREVMDILAAGHAVNASDDGS
ncbi:hypothetical protein QYH69_35155 [Paraburkholderia sp. SARCC-3016]|uniref:hypothetical protein n=1 Tax=Paraburkholderia sp. SARCC-3016 TaxID=3058611 RepID=UPI00280A072C|nr:hypothetical protein [Paraburkholderia sp. SARCC-3016]MDQ7982452.1 hypothetical protein [Paraburkholderia sp. SARCC-3016]